MISFSKLQGAGNDFIITTADMVKGLNYSKLAKSICNRHFGVGADGLMIVEESQNCDVKMRYYNSDGSEARMCGNGIRCFSFYVYTREMVKGTRFNVETLDGKKDITISLEKNNEVDTIMVNMGKPSLKAKDVPVVSNKEHFIKEVIQIENRDYEISSILAGVPHTVIFVNDLKEYDIPKLGPLFENHILFPNKTNVNFVQIIDRDSILVDTWERGAGKTLACGTGVCASVVIANLLNKVEKHVKVRVPGGELVIHIDEESSVFMEGKAKLICDGEYYYYEDLKI